MAEIRNRATLDSRPFTHGLGRMKGDVRSFGQQMRGMSRMLPGIGGALSVAALGRGLREAARHGNQLENLSRQMSLSVEAVQAYQFGLEEAGLSINDLQRVTDRLTRSQEEALAGNTNLAQSFGRLGISMDQVRGKNTEQLLSLVSQRMGEMEGDAAAAAASTQILGRKSIRLRQALIDLNKDGVEALIQSYKDMGVIIDEETARKLSRAEVRMSRASANMGSMFRRVAAEAMEAADQIARAFELRHQRISQADTFFEKLKLFTHGAGMGILQEVMEQDLRDAAKLAEEAAAKEARSRENRMREAERDAQNEIDLIRERMRFNALASEEQRRELQTKLDALRAEKEQTTNAIERLEILRQIEQTESQLSRIREERKEDEQRGGDMPVSALQRIGAVGSAAPGQAARSETRQERILRTMQNTERLTANQVRLLETIAGRTGGAIL